MNDEFEARAVNDNGTLSRSFGLFGDLFENLLNVAGIPTRDYRWDDVETLESKFESFCNCELSDYARRAGEDEDEIHDAADKIRAFLTRLRREGRGFCVGYPPQRPRATEWFVRPSWQRR